MLPPGDRSMGELVRELLTWNTGQLYGVMARRQQERYNLMQFNVNNNDKGL